MSLKVLIADYDWHFAQQASSFLESHAHLVVCESRSSVAIARAKHWQPDLVIASAELAGNGMMEALYCLKPRPAVLLTEHMERFVRAWQTWQKGGDELLMKPVFDWQDLHQAVVAALENAAAGRRQSPQVASA
ncbi:MAG: response regulator [Phycisphaerae bacterium]|nr:response regulator [Phycisphaerae bacterium]